MGGGTRYTAEQWNAWQKANVAANPLLYRLIDIKKRAKDEGLRFDPAIRAELAVTPERCPDCSVTMVRHEGRPAADSPSVDRFLPDLGYVLGNVRWICFSCNRRKNNSVRTLDVLGFLLNRSAHGVLEG